MVINGLTDDGTKLILSYNALDGSRGTAINPYQFIDIYDTCVDNGWSFVEKNGNVKLYDKDDILLIDKEVVVDDEDEVNYCEHIVTISPELSIAVNPKEPFKVVISKPNFETLEISNIYVTAGQPTVIRAALKPAIEALVTNKGLAIKANKENYGANRDFAIIP